MIRTAALVLFAVALRGLPLGAQTVADAELLLARGDTSRAIKTLERLAKEAPGDAEARYRAGQLYLARSVSGRDTILNRRRALDRFQEAIRLAPDSVTYWLTFAGEVRPADGRRLPTWIPASVSRAPKTADRAREWHTLAMLAHREGWRKWVSYSSRGPRYLRRSGSTGVRSPVGPADWKAVQSFLDDTIRIPDGRATLLADGAADLQAAIDIEPLNVDAAGLLTIMKGTGDGWDDAAAVTRSLLRRATRNGRAWALHGLVLARLGRWTEADTAFRKAFARMAPLERIPFRDLGRLLGWEEEDDFHEADASDRERFDARYWRLAQPLVITGVNEARTEFYARIVYAQYAWGDPWRGVGGLETDPGIISVRYGTPDFASAGLWIYTRPRLIFWVGSGRYRASYAVHGMEAYRVARIHFPALFENVPVVRTLDTVLVQTARFRGPADSLALMVVGAIPLRRMAQASPIRDVSLLSGAIVSDTAGHEIRRDRVSETVIGASARELQYRSWRLMLKPGDYLLRVEAALPALERGARTMQPLDLAPIPGSSLAISDVLVAQRVAPRDSDATRWSDFFIEPNAGRFAPGEPMDLLWEIYDLTPDSTGTARYTVELRVTVEAIERHIWYMRILGSIGDATGLSAVGEDQVSLRYARAERAAPHGIRTEYLTVDLKDAPPGRYYLEVVVRDTIAGTEAVTARQITVGVEPVLPTPLWRRQ